MDERKTLGKKLEESCNFAELLAQFSEEDREKIRYLLIGMKLNQDVRPAG